MLKYDYIITGGGGAGLSLVYQLLQSPLRDRRVLLIEKSAKDQNDRTWCFWETRPGPFEPIVHQRWEELYFYQGAFGRLMRIAPYTYKMIRGIDFYRFTRAAIADAGQVDVVQATVERIDPRPDGVEVVADGKTYYGEWCFNSILFHPPDKKSVHYLDQHFKGWFVRTQQPAFEPGRAILMDFRTPQHGEPRFLYVLPDSPYTALVEVAIFSNRLLSQEEYDQILSDYMEKYLKPGPFQVVEPEFGIIPMTDYPFRQHDGRVIHLGAAGGQTKPSTGYTFWRIQQHVAKLIDSLVQDGHPYIKTDWAAKRHQLYDRVLLHVLQNHLYPGDKLFAHLFRKNPPDRLLAFLNGETDFWQELKVMQTVPILKFMQAMGNELGRQLPEPPPNLP